MRLLAMLLIGLSLTTTVSAEAIPSVGFRTLDVPGIAAVVWYPTATSGPTTIVAGNPVFVGVPVVKEAPIDDRAHPVVLLSHGFSGLWRNQAWLAERLAQAGYIAVALDHPGTTFGNMDPAWATHLTDRPHHVTRVLDALLADQTFGSRIDRTRISVIGHSLGGSTALLLAGAVFDPALLQDACANSTTKLVCMVYQKGGMTGAMSPVSARDSRISAAVLLDMEGIRGFTPASLSALSIPVLALVSGVEDPALPLGWEGRAQSALLPAAMTRYAEIIGATHFSFMSECKPGAAAKLEEEAYVCQGETVPRASLHAAIAQTVIHFLSADTRMVSALQLR